MNRRLGGLLLALVCCVPARAAGQEKMDSIVNSLSSEMVRVRDENASLRVRVDSLTGLLREHAVEEGFYETALGEQANRFALIIAGLLSLIGLISYGGFRFEVMRQKAEVESTVQTLERRYNEMQSRVRESELTLYPASGNVSRLVSDFFVQRNGSTAKAALYNLRAALAFLKLHEIDQVERSRQVGIENLRLAESHLSKLPAEEGSRKQLASVEEELNKLLAEISSARDDGVFDEIVSIRLQLRRLKGNGQKPVVTG